jgi:hypothetical protein
MEIVLAWNYHMVSWLGIWYFQKVKISINLEMHPVNENIRLEGPNEGSHGSSNGQLSSFGSFIQLYDAVDEFFDVLVETEYDQRDMFPSYENTHAVVSSLFVSMEQDKTFVE